MSAALSYVPIPVDSLVGEAKIEFDLYVQLSTKHVLYLRKGNAFDQDRLAKMREKNVRNLWILGEDEARFRSFVEKKMDSVYDLSSTMDPVQRGSAIRAAQIQAIDAFLKTPTDPNLYRATVESAKKITDFILKNDDGLKILISVPNTEKNIAAHGFAVAALSVGIAKRLNMSDAKDLYWMTFGAMIHDMGHYGQSQPTGFGKPSKSLGAAELRIFKEHATQGMLRVQDQIYFEQLALKILLEHEELADGTGFPKGLNERQVHPYSLIVSTANSFDKLITFEGETPASALKRLFVEKIGRHPLTHLNAVKAIAATLG